MVNDLRRWIAIIESADSGFRSMIEQPVFQDWFRGSKIVDRHNEPLVVWHGLKSSQVHLDKLNKRVLFSPKFTSFDVTNAIEPGAWFSPDPGIAAHYGTPAPFFLRALQPMQHESPIQHPPIGHDAIYRMRSSRTNIWEAWEIAVFSPDQIRLAFDVNNPDLASH